MKKVCSVLPKFRKKKLLEDAFFKDGIKILMSDLCKKFSHSQENRYHRN